jgi:hypothetical protein
MQNFLIFVGVTAGICNIIQIFRAAVLYEEENDRILTRRYRVNAKEIYLAKKHNPNRRITRQLLLSPFGIFPLSYCVLKAIIQFLKLAFSKEKHVPTEEEQQIKEELDKEIGVV